MIFWPRPRFEWQLRTRTLALGERTRIMAVVGIHLYDGPGSAANSAAWAKVAVANAVAAVDARADIVDLQAEHAQPHPSVTGSATPFAMPCSTQEEQARLLPVLEALMMARPGAVVAVDAHYAETARAAIRAGAEIVNDLSGPGGNGLVWNEAMAEVVAQSGCGLVLRHARSREALADGPLPSDEVVPETFDALCVRRMLAESAGIAADQIVADPGLGLGREPPEDMALLAGLGRLRQLGRPLLVGVPLAAGAQEADLIRDVASHVAAILAGVHLLRVQDVAAARAAISVADAVLEASSRE
jgi:dihydropteroate synthase